MNCAYSYTPEARDLLRYALTVTMSVRDDHGLNTGHTPYDFWSTLVTVLAYDPLYRFAGMLFEVIRNPRLVMLQQKIDKHRRKDHVEVCLRQNLGANGPPLLEEYAADILRPCNFPLCNPLTVDHLAWLAIYYQRRLFPDDVQISAKLILQLQHSTGLRDSLWLPGTGQPVFVPPIRYRRRLY